MVYLSRKKILVVIDTTKIQLFKQITTQPELETLGYQL